jgi:probable rRNA maturation factor
MNVIIEINRQVSFRKFAKFDLYLQKIVVKALVFRGYQESECVVSVLICDDATIQNLNNEFRGKNKPTNVLSFPDGEKFGHQVMLGDIAISIETLRREALEQGKTFKTHFLHLFTHSILHLLGMDHEIEPERVAMEAMEDKIMDYISKL